MPRMDLVKTSYFYPDSFFFEINPTKRAKSEIKQLTVTIIIRTKLTNNTDLKIVILEKALR